MVDMCRAKKTGMAEECRQSDGKRADYLHEDADYLYVDFRLEPSIMSRPRDV